MCSVAVLMYLAFLIAGEPPRSLTQVLVQAIQAQEKILEQQEALTLPATVEFVGNPPYVALMSRGADLASVYQGALTLKEVARLAAEATSAAQFRHGPIEIINPAHRYVIFARDQRTSGGRRSKTGKFLLRLGEDIRAHGGRVLLLTDLPCEAAPNLQLIRVEPLRLGLGTLVDMLYIQLLAHELALRAGLEPGKFWIAEEVTREE
jgi:glutamine---fructose-6-phosphate transaminase (isomerizing)